MAYWSSTNFDQYAKHELWNVKPRWQELAEMSSGFSSAVTAPSPYIESMASTPDHSNADPRYRTRRALQFRRDDNVTELGAPRSRSRSRIGRLPTSISRTPSRSGQRGKLVLGRACQDTLSKWARFLMLLALVSVLLSWFGYGVFPYSGPFVRSVVGSVRTPQSEFMNANARHSLCRIPIVPRILHCGEPNGAEMLLRVQSLQKALPGIVVALSENPDAVDRILDVLVETKKQLVVFQSNTSRWWMQGKRKEISTLVQITTELEDQVIKWDAHRDILLDGMSRRLNGLASTYLWRRKLSRGRAAFSRWPRDIESKNEIQKAVLGILEAVVTVLDIMHQELDAIEKTVNLLSERMIVFTRHAGERDTGHISLVGRFVSWSLAFVNTPQTKHSTEIEWQRLLDKAQSIYPTFQAMHALIEKAHSSASAASTLIGSSADLWLNRLGRTFGRSEHVGTFFKDVMDGVSDTSNLSYELIEQRMDQREDRKMARWDVVLEAERNRRQTRYGEHND